ncbi:MAG: DUF4167 domain-containing protein [Parvibaculaceae bacterium]
MRQGQFKNRSRNRGRRPSSPLSRVYESNGPDVKVRGTAQHVAEKYLQLARDAMSSGDTVMGESYFQHAEHYLRIVAAAQTFQQQQHGYQPNQQRRPDEEGFEDGDETAGPEEHAPQPVFSEQPGMDMEPEAEPQQMEAAPAPQPAQGQPRGQQGGEGRRNWDGHQPDFLKRSSPGGNGSSGRTERPRRGRGRGNQNQQASEGPAEGSDSEQAPEQVG